MENARRGNESAVAFEGPAVGGGSNDVRVSRSPRLTVCGGSTMSKLMRREIGGLNGRRPPRPDVAFCAEKFRHFKLKEKFCIPAGDREISPWRAGSIRKIVLANDFIFVLEWYGICVAFHRTATNAIVPYEKHGGIWYFDDGEKMVDLFYNKINDSIIAVYSSRMMTRRGYTMRALPLENIRRRDEWGIGTPVFGSWTDNLPMFDSFNNLLAVISLYQDEQNFVNNIYETNNYQLVHSIPGQIHSIATRPGTMIVAYNIVSNTLPIEVISTESWMVLAKFSHPMPPHKRLKFVGLCCENLLLKQKNQNIHVIDLLNYGNVTSIENSKHETRLPTSSFDLIANNALLRLENGMIVNCNSRGMQVSLLEDGHNDTNYYTFHMCVTMDKNFAILYSKKFIENQQREIHKRYVSCNGTINICSTFSGKSIVELNPCNNIVLTDATSNDSDNSRTNEAESSALQKDLKFVTAIFYDDEHHKIYTGTTDGFIHVWST